VERRRLGVYLALLVAFVLAVSGCGGGDEGEPDSQSGLETAINDADQALAEASVLRLEDFPTGWREVVDDTPDSGADECFDPNFDGIVLTGRAESDNFEQGEVTSATSVAAVFESAEGAATMFTRVSDGTFTECVANYLRKSSDSDVTVKSVEAAKLAFPALGDESDARQVVAEIESGGLSPSVFVDMIAIRSGRAFSWLLFLDVFTGFDSDQEVGLANAVVGRMEAGQ
jgi:hypothetical protein